MLNLYAKKGAKHVIILYFFYTFFSSHTFFNTFFSCRKYFFLILFFPTPAGSPVSRMYSIIYFYDVSIIRPDAFVFFVPFSSQELGKDH